MNQETVEYILNRPLTAFEITRRKLIVGLVHTTLLEVESDRNLQLLGSTPKTTLEGTTLDSMLMDFIRRLTPDVAVSREVHELVLNVLKERKV